MYFGGPSHSANQYLCFTRDSAHETCTFTARPICMCAAAKTAWNLEKLLVLFKSKESYIFFMQPVGFGCIIQEILYYVCALGYLGIAQCGQWILDTPEIITCTRCVVRGSRGIARAGLAAEKVVYLPYSVCYL